MISRISAQPQLFRSFIAALIAALIGSLIGILAGFFGGKLDDLLMRSVDVLMAFPYILLALAIVAVLGPGLMNALIAVAIVNIPFFARNVRGVTLVIARSDYIAAARLSGRGSVSLLLFEVVPNLWSVIIVAFSTTVGWMILETAGLSFLGLGSQPPQSDLGSMLGEGRAALITNPHTSVIPGLMIFVIVMGINLLGDGVRDALDATEKKSRSMPWVVGLHPVFEIEVAHGQLMGIKQGFIVQRDAVSTIGKLTVDDGIVDAFRAESQFIPSGAIERSRQISRRRDGGQDFLRVTP